MEIVLNLFQLLKACSRVPVSFFKRSLAVAFVLSLTGCFAPQEAQEKSLSSSTNVASLIKDFAGAKTASNRITGIQIAWDVPAAEVSSYRVYRVSGTKLSLLTTLAPSVTGYIDGTASWGNIYSYIVRAVDKNNVEEINTAKVSALSWGGIASVEVTGRTSLVVNLASTSAVADEIRIYAQPAAGGTRTLVATATGSDTDVSISGLRTGYPYIISAQAYVATLKKEDGNRASFKATTNTLGYHDDDSSTAKWLNVVNVRAFGPSPGAPIHPTTPNKSPQTALVEVSFKSFSGMASATKYVVTRTSAGHKFDTSVQDVCTPTTQGSCRVMCGMSSVYLTGSGTLSCRDLQVAPAPARYRYTMSIENSEGSDKWIEPIPEDAVDSYSVLVPMPPANMVLVQRDAVNYEMCFQMSVNPDPKNHNRCAYTGVGAIPYNAGPGKAPLNLEAGYYDFGYNLFENRFPLGCKWTRGVDGGKCGTGATTGDCLSMSGAPANTIGKDGDVFENFVSYTEHGCYYKYQGAWYAQNSISTLPNPSAIYAQMYTANPSVNDGNIGVPRTYLSQYQTSLLCAGQVDANYGTSRLPRLREWRAFQAYATVPGELYGITYSQANVINGGGGNYTTNGSRCGHNTSSYSYYPTTLANMLQSTNGMWSVYSGGLRYGPQAFKIGAVATVDCQSRYGAQDVYSSYGSSFVSDITNWNSATMLLTGTSSPIDNGNLDLQQDVNGGQLGFQMSYSSATLNGTSNYYYYPASAAFINYFSIPMGLPISATTSNTYLPRLLFNENYSGRFFFPYTATPNTTNRSVMISSRWETSFTATALSGAVVSVPRCVLTAD